MEGANKEQEIMAEEKFSVGPAEGLRKKKIIEKILLAVIIVLIFSAFFVLIKKSGWRINAFIEKINYKKYNHIGPDFNFAYPDYYVFDADEQKKFGNSYIGGFRLKTDQRTGCDVRLSETGINFQKSEKEISEALEKDFSQNVKDFKLIGTKITKIDGEKAFLLDFSFTDPIGTAVRLSQIMVSHGGTNHLLICGTGEYQYKYFQKDFDGFFNSFQWKANAM